MKLIIVVKQANSAFDREYANQYQFGKESDGNWKYIITTSIKCQKTRTSFFQRE